VLFAVQWWSDTTALASYADYDDDDDDDEWGAKQ